MSYWGNRSLYYQLLEDFIEARIGGIEFENQFVDMWRKDRDGELLTIKMDSTLKKCVKSVFLNRHSQYVDTFAGVLSRIFTACDVFDPDLKTCTEHEYDEAALRNFVRDILAESRDLFE